MFWVGRDFKNYLVPTPCHGQRYPPIRSCCSKHHPVWAWTPLSTTCLGNLFEYLTTLTVKNLFLISNLNLLSFSLKPIPLVLSPHSLITSTSSSFLQAPFKYWKATKRCPQSLLFSTLNNPNSLSLSSQGRFSSPFIIFMAPLWTHLSRSIRSMSFFGILGVFVILFPWKFVLWIQQVHLSSVSLKPQPTLSLQK